MDTFLLPPWIPMLLSLFASLLMIKAGHHSKNVRLMHFIGRFYLFAVYFLATFNYFKFNLDDIQAFARFGLILLMLEEILVWFIEIRWPTIRRS